MYKIFTENNIHEFKHKVVTKVFIKELLNEKIRVIKVTENGKEVDLLDFCKL